MDDEEVRSEAAVLDIQKILDERFGKSDDNSLEKPVTVDVLNDLFPNGEQSEHCRICHGAIK
jgi:hypothetical protein